ncbi:hypothetical protein [Synechococcus sp. UW140]|uniref:hypothetical protein n=1 Tax=Synechococcus sp. UW140 TaxID=368503 RepID=UPI0010BD3CA7|nr:hypothetical protein [Synechococcus sp. UW140]
MEAPNSQANQSQLCKLSKDSESSPPNGGCHYKAGRKTVNASKAFKMTKNYGKSKQASRNGKSAICIFVKPEAKQSIIAALAEGGYGISFQEGITNLINELLSRHHKSPIT